VGPKTAEKLDKMGIATVGELAQRSEEELRKHFGKRGSEMVQQAQGIDKRSVIVEHERKSVSQERTFAHDLRDAKSLKGQLWKLSRGVARHLQKAGLAAGTIGIKLRYSDFETLTRQDEVWRCQIECAYR
jgi:DNA polymerase-4